jgi:translation initiation factor 2-alpha kinase 4
MVSIKIADPKTPMPRDLGTSPEVDYFRTPQRVRHASRWKEDWEELELLVRHLTHAVLIQ